MVGTRETVQRVAKANVPFEFHNSDCLGSSFCLRLGSKTWCCHVVQLATLCYIKVSLVGINDSQAVAQQTVLVSQEAQEERLVDVVIVD